MVRPGPQRRKNGLTESARTRQARQAQEDARVAGGGIRPPAQGETGNRPEPDAAGHETPGTDPSDVRLLRHAAAVRYSLLAISIVMLLWFMVALQGDRTGESRLPVPTWALNVAALGPLLGLIRFWNPEIRKKTDTLEFDLRVFSGLYLVMGFLSAALGGYRSLWIAVAISAMVHIGIWYTNRRAIQRG
ncbi:hypothetical protein [Streptomyces shenzhenensis]|uniref:hypothetical protein n=1 Tax=Streptomyces shenzhenensis TaxID=943815 RepID=UPI003411B5D2